MIGSLGLPELLFILVLALLVFGPRKLPEIGRTLGRALGEFRRATSDLKRTLDVELTAEDLNPIAPSKPVGKTTARQIEERGGGSSGEEAARSEVGPAPPQEASRPGPDS